ncbi:hypothetical protein L9F63_026171, partial [Diploptera punctata]
FQNTILSLSTCCKENIFDGNQKWTVADYHLQIPHFRHSIWIICIAFWGVLGWKVYVSDVFEELIGLSSILGVIPNLIDASPLIGYNFLASIIFGNLLYNLKSQYHSVGSVVSSDLATSVNVPYN